MNDNRNYIYALNWKMAKPYKESIDWCKKYGKKLQSISGPSENIIIFPDFTSLVNCKDILPDTISIGSQDCSEHISGAYTGQVSAICLAQIGIEYGIVGHSERRQLLGENTYTVAKKAKNLLDVGIEPIICVGETLDQKKSGISFDSICNQIDPVIEIIKDQIIDTIHIAYEPVWAIGAGITPGEGEIENMLSCIETYIALTVPFCKTKFLYGGSIGIENIVWLKKIQKLSGFLIGRSGLIYEDLEQIILNR